MTPEKLAEVLGRADVQLGIDLIVADARSQALEEAARVVLESPYNTPFVEIAAAIRALKDRDYLQADIDKAHRTNPDGSILD